MPVILRDIDCSMRTKQGSLSLLCATQTVREANVINPLRGSSQGLLMYHEQVLLWVTGFSAELLTRKIKCVLRAVLWQSSPPFEVSEKRREIWKHFWRKAAFKYFPSFLGVLHELNYLKFSKALLKLPKNNVVKSPIIL